MAKIKLVVSATIEETFSDFIISKKTKGLAEKTLQSYQSQFQAVARHMDVKMDIAMLQKADLDAMIISMRDAHLSPNSINSYTRTLKSFFSWCNEQGKSARANGLVSTFWMEPVFMLSPIRERMTRPILDLPSPPFPVRISIFCALLLGIRQ